MKRVININFQGRIIPIEESAYDILKQYIENLSHFFENEEGKVEIINDIEGRIGELFAETLKKGSTCICEEDINKIIASMGRPEDFEAEETFVKEQLGGNSTNQNKQQNTYTNTSNTHANTKMFRDENNKILGGVCSGLANYFNIDATIIRIITIILVFSFGIGILPYFILWVVVPSSSTQAIGSVKKRLFRDTDDKVIAGICSGLAQYFGINVWVPRLLFALPFISIAFKIGHLTMLDLPDFLSFSISPGSFIVYVILWIILPEALTAADKLEMKGEKVDMNSIKNTIQNDMEGFGKRVENWGERVNQKANEFNETITEKSKQFTAETNNIARRNGSKLGNVIVLIGKIISYSIIGILLFAVIISLFSIGVVLTGLLPAKAYLINDGWQNILAWGTLLLFIWIPVIGALTFIIRRLTKSKANSNAIRYTFTGLWIVGWVCLFAFIASVFNDFKYKNTPIEETVVLSNPKVNSLFVNSNAFNKYYTESWFDIAPFSNMGEDTAFVKNYSIRIVKSNNDSFQVKMVRLSNGKNRNIATTNANDIKFTILQQDSVLKLDKGIAINKHDKFRNQHVIITIAVPVGKRIKVSDETFWGHHNNRVSIGWDDEDWGNYVHNYFGDGESFSYGSNIEYIMTAKGLERTDKSKIKENSVDNEDDNKLENYKNSREELRQQLQQEKQDLDEKARQLKEKENEFNKVIDSSLNKKTTQKTTQKISTKNSNLPLNNQVYFGAILLDKFSI